MDGKRALLLSCQDSFTMYIYVYCNKYYKNTLTHKL